MAIEIPSAAVDLMNLYGLPWPDVDEDGFHDLKSPLRDFGNDLEAVGDDIIEALQELQSDSPSQTVGAIIAYFQAVRRDFLEPIKQFCNDLAGWPCDATYDAICALKATVIGMLVGEVANDVGDVVVTVFTAGLAAPEAAAEAILVREAISQTLQEGEAAVISTLESAATNVLDNFVASVVNPFINQVENRVEGLVDSYLPHLALQAAFASDEAFGDGRSGGQLRMVESQLEQSAEQIGSSTYHLTVASTKLDAAIKEIFSHPQPGLPHIPTVSSTLRAALKDILDTVRSELVAAVEQLAEHVAQHFINLLRDFLRAVKDLDALAAKAAAAEKMASFTPVVVLSAAGVASAASAGIVTASGLVNAEEADSVSVQQANTPSVELVEEVVARVDTTPLVTEATATSTEAEEALDIRIDKPTVSVTVVETTSPSGVETLTVKTETNVPHAVAAQSGVLTSSTAVTSTSTEHGGAVHAGTAIASGVPAHLVVKHRDEIEPKEGNATAAAHNVDEVQARDDDL